MQRGHLINAQGRKRRKRKRESLHYFLDFFSRKALALTRLLFFFSGPDLSSYVALYGSKAR